jgi:mRNA-degrading endonuclease RelE of RelBE toxin-antitoxin system
VTPWHVTITDEADKDLRRLRKVRRKAWQETDRLLDQLAVDPHALGATCDPPLVGCRREHFWNDKYRLVWRIVPQDRRVDVLGCDLKTQNFYGRMAERLAGLLGQ